jgi:hypothetical protein
VDELVLVVPPVGIDVLFAHCWRSITKLLDGLSRCQGKEAEDPVDGALFVFGTGKGASVPATEIERTILPFLGVQANGAECPEVKIPEVDCVVKVAIS